MAQQPLSSVELRPRFQGKNIWKNFLYPKSLSLTGSSLHYADVSWQSGHLSLPEVHQNTSCLSFPTLFQQKFWIAKPLDISMCLKSPANSSLEETGTQTHSSLSFSISSLLLIPLSLQHLLLTSRWSRHRHQRRVAIGNLVYFYIWKLESATVYKQFAKCMLVAKASSVSVHSTSTRMRDETEMHRLCLGTEWSGACMFPAQMPGNYRDSCDVSQGGDLHSPAWNFAWAGCKATWRPSLSSTRAD